MASRSILHLAGKEAKNEQTDLSIMRLFLCTGCKKNALRSDLT
jgi:hypothetical protein